MKKILFWLAAGIVVVSVIGVLGDSDDQTEPAASEASEPITSEVSEPNDATETEALEEVVTAEMIVDITFADKANRSQFCDSFDVLGWDLGLESFATGYTSLTPSAEEVFTEGVSRC